MISKYQRLIRRKSDGKTVKQYAHFTGNGYQFLPVDDNFEVIPLQVESFTVTIEQRNLSNW
jgi:hypothetical protein